MEVRLSTRQWAMIKRTAQNVNPLVSRKATLMKAIQEAAKEVQVLNNQISGFESGIKELCGGLGTENLVVKVVSPYTNEDGTVKTDNKGKELTKTQYVPTELVKYIEDGNYYVVTIPEPENPIEENITE